MLRLVGGARPSHPAKLARRTSLEHHPEVRAALAGHLSGASPLPTSASNAAHRPGIFDQGRSGSCEPHSGSASLFSAFSAAGMPLGFIPSMSVLYRAARARERAAATQVGQPLPPLTDTGLETADLVAIYAEYGIADRLSTPGLVDGLTPDGRLSDVWGIDDLTLAGIPSAHPGNLNEEPDLQGLLASGRRLVIGPYGVDPTQANASDVLAAAISLGIPVQMAFFCDSAFQQLSPGQIASAPNISDTTGGGHATYLDEYDTMADGSRIFTLVNSWGTGWCNGGTCRVGPAWLRGAWEAWPYAVAKGAAAMKEAA